MKKKILALVLAALMLCSVLPVTASAQSGSLLNDEVFNDDVYYHLDYIEKEDYFKTQINLYTSLGLYDRAWLNYYTGEVDVNYAEMILLALIEKVDVEYQNEDFETIIKVLEGASSVAEVIDKVNEYTGVLDFAESNEWATSITVLNTLIKAANYSNEMYKAFIDGYAAILSAKAASIYYSSLLTQLIDNCENSAVRAAAQRILDNINSELEAAVKKLVEELAASAAEDAVGFGVSIAMSSNSVTAAIQSAYKMTTGLSEKLFKTGSKYGYMCSLAEIYYIESCLRPWALDNLAAEESTISMKDFSVSAFISLREAGESLLAGLAATKDKTLEALTSSYNVDEIKVRTAVATAKLEAIRSLVGTDDADSFTAIFASTGSCDLIVRTRGTVTAIMGAEDEVATMTDDIGKLFNVYNDTLGTYIKVVFLNGNARYSNISVFNCASSVAYLQIDSLASGALALSYATVPFVAGRTVTTLDVMGVAPSISAKNASGATCEGAYSDTFSVTAIPMVFELTAEEIAAAEAAKVKTPLEKVTAFFEKVAAFFAKLFFIFS